MHVAACLFGGECTGLLLRRSQEGLCQARKATSVHFGRAPQCTGFAFTIFLRFEHAQTASSQPSRMHFGTDSKRICSPHSGSIGSVRPCWAFTWRFGLAQTASSQPSRIHFGTDSKCIWSPHSGLGVWGHVGLLHGDLGTHKTLRHNLHEYMSARILNASAPRTRVWQCGAMLGFYTAIWARPIPCVTNLTIAFLHGF